MERLPQSWQDEYNTGVNFIDEQHLYFFKLVKELEEVVNTDECRIRISNLFFSLVHYYEKYMLDEEIYLKNLNYPKLNEHKIAHQRFIEGIINFKDDFAANTPGVCKKLLEFLHQWWIEHILNKDNRVIESFRSI